MADLCGNDEGIGGWDPGPCILPSGHGPDHTDGRVHWRTCIFCQIAKGRAPATVVRQWHDAIAIVPLDPVVDGHVIVIPKTHVRDVWINPAVSATTMLRAAELAQPPCNVITSAGAEATQTVMHLHIHVVPRRAGDGLALPWTGQKRAAP